MTPMSATPMFVTPLPTESEPVPPEPQQAVRSPQPYLVGRDGAGHWVAVDGRGLGGGLFRTREAATRYVCGEVGCRPSDVTVSAATVRLALA